MRAAAVATVVTLVLCAVILLFGSCDPMPPVNPPSCAQDPTQDWCAPPQPILFTAKDGGAKDGAR